MIRRFSFLAIFFLLLCRSVFAQYPVVFKDALGSEFQFSSQPKRIISVIPSITESLFYIGAGSQLVGATKYCNFPEAAKKLPRVGDLNLNYERIVSLNPDLIIGDPVLISKSLDKLRSLNLRVLALRTQKIQEILQTMKDLGRITGHTKEATEVTERMKKILDEIASKTSSVEHPRVFLEVWDQPLMTVGPDAFLGELIELAGGKNVANDITRAWAQISEEVVIQKDPEVLLLLTGKKDAYMKRPEWKNVTAIRKGRVYQLNRDLYSQPSPRLIEALTHLTQLLHPEIQQARGTSPK
jgi:iron complex transport system substrate-binding protein